MPTTFPLFSIVGTTSVGKSEAVFHLCNVLQQNNPQQKVVIISADSRQIFEGLEILSGADIPDGFVTVRDENISPYPFFRKSNTEIFGLSFLAVSEDWSVSQFQAYAHYILQYAVTQQAVVFVVGGTGLYHKHLLNSDPTLHIPPNPEVRAKASGLSVAELQLWLQQINQEKFTQMNNSDQHNPRRLVRAIEVALTESFVDSPQPSATTLSAVDHYYVGLKLPLEVLEEKILERVKARFSAGAVAEVQAILHAGHLISPQASTTLGFAQLTEYIVGKTPAEDCMAAWALADFQYSKRQLTWWKKENQVEWFDRSEADWLKKLEQSVLDRIVKSSYT